MIIETKKLQELIPADYNPRKDLERLHPVLRRRYQPLQSKAEQERNRTSPGKEDG